MDLAKLNYYNEIREYFSLLSVLLYALFVSKKLLAFFSFKLFRLLSCDTYLRNIDFSQKLIAILIGDLGIFSVSADSQMWLSDFSTNSHISWLQILKCHVKQKKKKNKKKKTKKKGSVLSIIKFDQKTVLNTSSHLASAWQEHLAIQYINCQKL